MITADRLRSTKHDTLAAGIDEVLEQLPDDKKPVIWKKRQIQKALNAGDIQKAKADIETLFSAYCNKPDFVKHAHELGWQFVEKADYETALRIYRGLLELFPDHKRSAWIQRSIIQTYVVQGDMENARQEVEMMFNNFSDKPDFVKHAHELGGWFVGKADYKTMLRIYSGLLELFPDHRRSAWIQRSIVQTYFKQGDTAKALEAVEEMKNNFQTHPDYENQMEKLVGDLVNNEQPEQARIVCETLVEKFPEHTRLPWILQAKARSEVQMNRQDLADTTVEVMRQKCASHRDYADALSWTAYEYLAAGFYERAIELYESVLALDANKKAHLRSVAGIAQSYARLGNDEQAMAKVNYLLSNFEDNSQGVAFYILGIVEDYYKMALAMEDKEAKKALLQKAIDVAELKLDKYPDIRIKNPGDDAGFYNLLGDCYRRLEKYDKAIECYEIAAYDYPGYVLAWNAQCKVGQCAERLKQQGYITKDEAEIIMANAYKSVIENYSECSLAGHACLKLAQMSLDNAEKDIALDYYKLFLELAYTNDPRIGTIRTRIDELGGDAQ